MCIIPRLLPAYWPRTRAQCDSTPSPIHGNVTFTRPIWSGSVMLLTIPTTTP